MTQPAADSDRMVHSALSFFEGLLGNYPPRDFNVRLWEGTLWGASPEDARYTLVIRHPGALRKMFLPANQLTLGEAYLNDDFDIEGDMESAIALGDHILSLDQGFWEKVRLGKTLLGLPAESPAQAAGRGAELRGAVHSRKRDSLAVTYHYNVSNDFYRLWLDERMVYSCAYFTSPGDSLDAAQEQKLDYICRKLRLCPGEKLLDLGCGWGGSSSMPPAIMGWMRWESPSAGPRPSSPMNASGRRGWPTDAGPRFATTARWGGRASSTSWSVSGCSSTWGSHGWRNISSVPGVCCVRAESFSIRASPAA